MARLMLTRGMLLSLDIHELVICESEGVDLGENVLNSHLPGIAVSWQTPASLTQHVFAPTLRRLRIQFTLEHELDTSSGFELATSLESFAGLWAGVPNLQELDLEIRVFVRRHWPAAAAKTHITTVLPLSRIFKKTVFDKLTTLTLRSMWLEAADLSQFISAHKATLQYLTLHDITLGDTERNEDMIAHVPWLVTRPNADDYHSNAGFFPPLYFNPALPEDDRSWVEVMGACQAIKSLRGLALHGAAIRLDKVTLSKGEVDKLLDMGMNGRVNEMAAQH